MVAHRTMKTESLSAVLRKRILELQSDKPVKLLSERELSAQFGVSRMTLRHVLKKLKEEGILTQKQGSGTYIASAAEFDRIGILVAPDLKTDDPFYAAFMAQVHNALSKRSISIRFLDYSRLDSLGKHESPLIIIGIVDEERVKQVVRAFPFVVSVHMYADLDSFSQVFFDDYGIGYRAAAKLIERNHTVLVHLAGPLKYPSPRFRSQGFHHAAERKGLESVELYGKMNYTCGANLSADVLRLLEEKKGKVGVFASNDWMALGLMHSLQEEGVRIPEDLSIIGCDDIPLASQREPALSTFRWDFELLINEVLDEFALMRSPAYRRRKIMLNAQYIDRGSVL